MTNSSALIRDELAQEHIPYEIAMMRGTYELLGMPPNGQILMRNVLIESFALHCRALIEFFEGRSGSDARHFTGPDYKPAQSASKYKDKLNQQIAHITEKRVTEAALKFNDKDFPNLRRLLDDDIAAFIAALTPHYRGIWDAHGQLANN